MLRCASLNGACVIQKLTAFGLPELIRNRFLSDFSLLSLFLKRGTGRGRGKAVVLSSTDCELSVWVLRAIQNGNEGEKEMEK